MHAVHTSGCSMERIHINMNDEMVSQLDNLVEGESLFANRSEAVRYAIREMLQKEEAQG